jgi:hypothetical protein
MAALIAVGTIVGCIIAGAILLALGFTLIGIIVAVAGVPIALVAWITAGDRL